jgi:uncharacterized membrane protein
MDFSLALENIDWLAVVIAFVVSMAWGFVWYSPGVAGKAWAKAAGTKLGENKNMPMMVTTILSFVAAFVLGLFSTNVEGIVDGVTTAMVISIGFVLTSLVTMYLFSDRPKNQILIDSVSIFVNYSLMGLAFGLSS